MKKVFWKKTAALLIAVVMLSAVFSVPTSAAQVVNTELLNRGFVKTEKVLDYKGREAPTGWQRVEGNVVDFEAAADANGVVIDGMALKLDFNANLANNISNYRSDYNWFGYYQNVKVEKYTEYTFSFWVLRNEPATSAVALGQVKAFGGDDTNLVKLEATKTTGGWEFLSGTFNSGNNDAVTVQLFTYAAGVDSTDMVVYFDYVSLEKGTTVDPEAAENLIANGDMELFNDIGTPFERLDTTAEPYWHYDGANFNGKVKPYERINGVSGYGLTATNRLSWLGQIYQTVTLEADTDYTFSIQEKANHTDVVMLAYIIPESGTNDSNNDELVHLEKALPAADTWQKLSETFNSYDVTTARVVLRYYKQDATLDEDYHFSFDDVVLIKQKKPVVANGDMELFNDIGTSFERLDTRSTPHWEYDGANFNGVVKPYERINGVSGYGLTAINRLSWLGQIYQTITLEANTNYTFSFYEKSNSTDAVMFGYVIPENGTNNDTNALIKLEKGISAVDTWQRLSGTFNSGDVTNARVVLRYYKRGATTNDDIDEDCHFSFDEVLVEKEKPHSHTYAYVNNGDAGHKRYCLGCNESVNEKHVLKTVEIPATATQVGKVVSYCEICGYYVAEECSTVADVNFDSVVDIRDLVRAKRYFVEKSIAIDFKALDLDSSGEITAADITLLKQCLLAETVIVLGPVDGAQVANASKEVADFVDGFDCNARENISQNKNVYARDDIVLKWFAANQDETYTVLISENADMSDAMVFTTAKTTLLINNLNVNTDYYWQIACDDYVGEILSFHTADTIRTLKIDGVSNTRDIGGWAAADGKTVKYGMAYRGARLANENNLEITSAGKDAALNVLKIKTDLDLRTPGEGGAGGTVSPLGNTVNYYNYNGAFYIGRDQGLDDPVFKSNFANEVRTFADPANYPIYFHCTIGRDRTGTLALVINGLLGVSKSDLFLDYELSLLSASGSAINDTNYTELMAMLTATYDYIQSFAPTGTFAEATESYLLSIGITQTEINTIRSLMLE